MKRVLKGTGYAVAGLLVIAGLLVGWVEATYNFHHPDTPMPAITASTDPQVIAQGKYIVDNVAHCSVCHAEGMHKPGEIPDLTKPLSGGNVWHAGPFGVFTAANITPDSKTGIGSYTDGELARAIRHSVAKDGRLLAFMRIAVGPMSDEDLTAVISYLRAQKPVEVQRDGDDLGLLAKALSSKFTPRMQAAPPYAPAGTVSVERGRYLAEGPGACLGCHSPADPAEGFALTGPAFSGASEADPDFTEEGYEIIPPNLTPDPKGVLNGWSEDAFVARFRQGRVYAGSKMPWENFSGMHETDLRSIYRFLRSLPPAPHDVGPSRRKAGSFVAQN